MRKITDDLIEKFLRGDCTEEEAAIVSSYLRKNPDDQYMVDEYERADSGTSLPPGYREDMLRFITEHTIAEPLAAEVVAERPARLRTLWRWTAAAAVIILAFIGWQYIQQPGARVMNEKPAPQTAGLMWIDKYNNGKKEIEFVLPDSSKVRLLPGAHLHYRKDFIIAAQRDVQLTGRACFDVAKNVKPFTVYSDGLQTRVLGTTFEVNANPYSDRIKVKLLTGKVVVSLQGNADTTEKRDYYLNPGQELVFTRSTRNVAINDPAKLTKDTVILAKSHAVKADTISNWYMFNNQKLADVFDQLSAIYNVDIEYSRDDINDLYFIGKLDKKDSLVEIIEDIALLNHLSVSSHNGRYIIKKGKP